MRSYLTLLNNFEKSTLKSRLKDLNIIDLLFYYNEKEDTSQYIVFYELLDNIFTYRIDIDDIIDARENGFQGILDLIASDIIEDIDSTKELFFDNSFNDGLYSEDTIGTISRVIMYEFASFYIAGFSQIWPTLEYDKFYELVKNLLDYGKTPIEIRRYFFHKHHLDNDYLTDRILNLNNEKKNIDKFK